MNADIIMKPDVQAAGVNGISCLLVVVCVQLMMILIKVSDISNEARPMEVAEPWLDCLLQEFYNQVESCCRD